MQEIIKYSLDNDYKYIACYFLLPYKYNNIKEDMLKSKNIYDIVKFCYRNNYKDEVCQLVYDWMIANDILYDNGIIYQLNNDKIDNNAIQILQYMTVFFYYSKYKKLGDYVSNIYYINKKIDSIDNIEISRGNCLLNMKYYINKLQGLERIDIKFNPVKLQTNDGYYNTCNPSIIKTEYGYLLNMRFVNYTQQKAVHFQSLDTDGKIRTCNKLIKLDKKFNTISEHQMIDKSWKSKLDTSRQIVNGMEDVILFKYKGNIYATCTTLDISSNYQANQNICIIDINDNAEINELSAFRSPNNNNFEKNWLPISDYGDKINIIYLHNPFTKVNIDQDQIYNNQYIKPEIIYQKTHDILDLSSFRGSASPIKMDDDNYLGIIHEVIHHGDRSRVYMHRFIVYNSDITEIIKISPLFYFDHLGIEFCRSICRHHNDNKIIITVGLEDNEGILYSKNINDIYNLLIDIDDYKLVKM